MNKIIKTNMCRLNKRTNDTDSGSLNSMQAMPLKRLVLLHVIILTSLTLPTEEKNSSKSLALIRCDSCITNTVLASRSSGDRSSNTGPPTLLTKYNGSTKTTTSDYICCVHNDIITWFHKLLSIKTSFIQNFGLSATVILHRQTI